MKIDNDLYKYSYDDLYNITHIYLNNELLNEYTYDNINELIEDKNYKLNKLYKFTYDTEGNILKKQEYELSTHRLLKEDTYEYSNPNWEDQLTKFNNESITYDNIGNPLTIGDTTLTWTNGRQLQTYTENNLNISYTYNIDGIRTSKTSNGITTNYYLEGRHIIFEKTGTNMIYYIRDENGELIGLRYNNNTYFYKKNYQGDIIEIYDSNYNLIVNYSYDSWGNIILITDNNNNEITDPTNIGIINPYRYRSYYYDTETKLYYLNSRYYNPNWGRFINADGLLTQNNLNSLGMNLYVYCENNPNSYKDSAGRIAESILNGVNSLINNTKDIIKEVVSNNYTGVFSSTSSITTTTNEESVGYILNATSGNKETLTYGDTKKLLRVNYDCDTANSIISSNLSLILKLGVEQTSVNFGLDNTGVYKTYSFGNYDLSLGIKIDLAHIKIGLESSLMHNISTENPNISKAQGSFTNLSIDGIGIILGLVYYFTGTPVPAY